MHHDLVRANDNHRAPVFPRRASDMNRKTRTMTGTLDARPAAMMRAFWMGLLALAFMLAQTLVAQARPESLAPLAQKISPSVVNITTSTTVEGRTGPRGIVPEGSPFEDFFREFQDRNGPGDRPRRSSALGSGFVISEDGYIVTNNHVIEMADEITIEFFAGDVLPAEVVGTDPNTDIA